LRKPGYQAKAIAWAPTPIPTGRASASLGLDACKARRDLDLSLFKPPPKAGDQLRLL